MPSLEVIDVERRFGRKTALDGISLSLEPGHVYGVIGTNGAGKTTLLKLLLGLDLPSSGSIRVLGLDPSREADAVAIRQRVGYVAEEHCFYRDLPGSQILAFVSDIYENWDQAECERVATLLKLPLDQKIKTLSRGEQTKLALTIALSMRPDLLLLDEPTSGLDPLVRRDFLDAIITLIEARECTVLFSTHILSDVERVADTVLIMNEGKLVETATLAQLQARYTRASFVFDLSPDDIELPGALSMQKGARELLATFADVSDADLKALAEQIGARDVARVPMALEDIFLQLIDPSEDSV